MGLEIPQLQEQKKGNEFTDDASSLSLRPLYDKCDSNVSLHLEIVFVSCAFDFDYRQLNINLVELLSFTPTMAKHDLHCNRSVA